MGHKQSKPFVHWCPNDGTPLSVGCGYGKRDLMARVLFKRVSEVGMCMSPLDLAFPFSASPLLISGRLLSYLATTR